LANRMYSLFLAVFGSGRRESSIAFSDARLATRVGYVSLSRHFPGDEIADCGYR
jgi:hypothetical protein